MPEITDVHAKYYAHALSVMGGKGLDRIGRALFDSAVTPNPYQIEAALFALRSTVSQDVMLADEVGLGKTIESGIALCQYWAERRRRLLVICPASLRTQWAQEMHEKFPLGFLYPRIEAKVEYLQVRYLQFCTAKNTPFRHQHFRPFAYKPAFPAL